MTVAKGIIYALYGVSQNDILYIGSTCDVFTRYNSHNIQLRKGHEPIYRHLREIGCAINIAIIDEHANISEAELKRQEEYWIDQFRQWGFSLKNVANNLSYKWGKKRKNTDTVPMTDDFFDELNKENDFFCFTNILSKAEISRSSLYRMIKDGKVREKALGRDHRIYSLKDVINNKPKKK